jgi:hypothetical protein
MLDFVKFHLGFIYKRLSGELEFHENRLAASHVYLRALMNSTDFCRLWMQICITHLQTHAWVSDSFVKVGWTLLSSVNKILSIFCSILLPICIKFTCKSSTKILLRDCGFHVDRRNETCTSLNGVIDFIYLPPTCIWLLEYNSDSRSLASSAKTFACFTKIGGDRAVLFF